MKNLFFLFVFLNSINSLLSQDFSEIISLREKSLAVVEETLISKGWNFMNGESETEKNYGFATFGLGKIKNTNNTESIITLLYTEKFQQNRIDYIISNEEKYIKILNTIKDLGYELIDSKIWNGQLVKMYRNSKLTIEIAISTEYLEASGYRSYSFLIVENADYDQKSNRLD